MKKSTSMNSLPQASKLQPPAGKGNAPKIKATGKGATGKLMAAAKKNSMPKKGKSC
jgi:type III secretion system FlhB-like substrate exporter